MGIPQQLEMRRPHLEDLPERAVPAGCALRTYRPGDEVHWARIMNDCVGQGWTAKRCLTELVSRPQFRAGACFMVIVDGVPQGSATAWVKGEPLDAPGYVHMVGVAPAFRGRGLGRLLTLATLHWFRDHGFREVILHTDDFRFAAIRTYLALGFEPVLFDERHTSRWAVVRERLARRECRG